MSTAVVSLWPSLEEIGSADYSAPVVIMRQQAEAISLMTNNLLEGQVVNIPVRRRVSGDNNISTTLIAATRAFSPQYEDDPDKLRYAFYLRASALSGVKVALFNVTHDVAFAYPVIFEGSSKAAVEFNHQEAQSEAEFVLLLRDFFHSEEVITILQSLIAQSIGPNDSLTATRS